MKVRIAILLLMVSCAAGARAQAAPAKSWELGAGYDFVHTNAPPSGCGCFSMNGGTASVAWRVRPAFDVAGEFNGTNNGNIRATGRSLVLLTYLAGPRYRYVAKSARVVPYGQVLVGGAHASGGLYASGTANSFAMAIGGGLDVAVRPRVAVKLVQAEYLMTLLPNGVNDRQNNVAVSAGVVFRFGR